MHLFGSLSLRMPRVDYPPAPPSNPTPEVDEETRMNTTCPLEMLAPSPRLAEFDAATARVTQQRGKVYGHPKKDFGRVARLKAVVAECEDARARHALEMICVKVARLIQTPDHVDSWTDIAGYARTGVMATDPE